MAVAPNGTPNTFTGHSTTSGSHAVTLGTLVNGVLLVTIAQFSNTDSTPTFTLDGSSTGVSLVSSVGTAEVGGTRRLTVYRVVVGSGSGASKNGAPAWSSTVDEYVAIYDRVENVDQSSPTGTPVTASGQASSTNSNSIPSVVGGIVYDCLSADATTAVSATANLTLRARQISGLVESEGAAQYANGTGSNISASWSNLQGGVASFYVHIGFPVNEATGGVVRRRIRLVT